MYILKLKLNINNNWYKIIDDVKKISRLNAPNFNGLVVAWKVWKEKDTKSKVTGVNWPRTLQCLS